MIRAFLSLIFLLIAGTATAQKVNLSRFTDLDVLKSNAKRYPAPVELRRYLGQALQKDLADCISDPRWDLKKAEDFFAAIPVRLSVKKAQTWLAFPTQYCPAMFGASSTPYWIVLQLEDGRFKQLRWGVTHQVKISREITNGFYDLIEKYGNDPEHSILTIWYDGKQYTE